MVLNKRGESGESGGKLWGETTPETICIGCVEYFENKE